ncbi:MAG: TolB family protein [Actinomycetota bacterium]
MSGDRYDVLERLEPLFDTPEPDVEEFLRRRDRKRRNERIAAGFVALVVFAAPFALFGWLSSRDRTERPAAAGSDEPGIPNIDYVIDLDTGAMTPLPRAIFRSMGSGSPLRSGGGGSGEYAASPDGSLVAYMGRGDHGDRQIYVARIDGTEVRQVTLAAEGAASPAWSPDGTRIVYEALGGGDSPALFILDVATGRSTEIEVDFPGRHVCNPLEVDRCNSVLWPQFTPDGSSILFTGGTNQRPVLRTVPVAGGESTLLIGPGNGLTDAGNGSMSPDGSLVTFLASGSPLSPGGSPLTYNGKEIRHVGPGRFLAKVDGSGLRFLPGHVSSPAGTWSPDGSRIVTSEIGSRILVVEVASGDVTTVARGRAAIWLDDHTLLVEV